MGGEGQHLSFPSPNAKRAFKKEEKEKTKQNKIKPGLSNEETSNCSSNRRKLGTVEKKNVHCHFDINIMMAVKCALLEIKKSCYAQGVIK